MSKRTDPHPATPARVPAPPAIFVGRDRDLERLEGMLARVPVAILYGVAGVGKSTLAYALARKWPGASLHVRAGREQALSSLLDDVRRRLASGPVREAASDDERFDDVVVRMDATGSLLVLDDLHHLGAGARLALVEGLGAGLERGRLVATSRERLVLQTLSTDRVELELRGLDADAARLLWAELDRLYGPAQGADAAFERHRGNPFLTRRAHAGEVGVADPLAAMVRELRPEQRPIAGLLALAEVPLPVAELAALSSDDAVLDLVRRLIADVDASGVRVHDLVRDTLRNSLSSEECVALHDRLSSITARQPALDPVVRVREVSRHLRGGGRFGEAGDYLVQNGALCIRNGAAGELLSVFDAIPAEHRSDAVRVARARTLARQLQVAQAYEELRRLYEAQTAASPELLVTFAHIAMLHADFASAQAALARLDELAELSPIHEVRARTTQGMLLSHAGRGDEGRAVLEAAERSSAIARFRANFALTRAFTLFMEERIEEAEEPLAFAATLYREAASSFQGSAYQGTALALPLVAAVRARQGRREESARVLAELDELLARRGEDRILLAEIDFLRACIRFDAGDREGALEAFWKCERMHAAGGYVLGALWSRAWAGRVQLALGRRLEATRTLDAAATDAAELGILGVFAGTRRARQADPAAELRAHIAGQSQRRPADRRGRAFDALVAAARGDAAPANALEREAESSFERMLLALARATLARVRGDSRQEIARRREVETLAAAAGVDAGVVADLLACLGTVRIVAGEQAQVTRELPDLSRYEIVIDARTHEIRRGRRVISLRRYPVIRRLLYALAGGAPVDKEALARALWEAEYRPVVHDNALWTNVKRLRRLIAPLGLAVEATEAGYQLSSEASFALVSG